MLTRPDDADLDPRVARSRAKIRAAVVDRLCADGYEAMSMEAIAEGAGVGKATIYRHWPSKAALTVDTLACLKKTLPPPDSGNTVQDLRTIAGHLASVLSSQPWSGLLPTLVDAAGRDPDLAEHMDGFREDRRGPLRAVLQRAIDREELPTDCEVDDVVDRLVGPIFYRRFIMGTTVDADWLDRLVDSVWRGVAGR